MTEAAGGVRFDAGAGLFPNCLPIKSSSENCARARMGYGTELRPRPAMTACRCRMTGTTPRAIWRRAGPVIASGYLPA